MRTTTSIIDEKVRDAAQLLGARRDAFLEDPNDIETNHKLRVSIRTLRSLLDFLSPWIAPKQRKTIAEDLKRVVKVTSRLRELDVLGELAASIEPAAAELLAFCAGQAALERAVVYEEISGERARKRIDVSVESLAHLQWKPSIVKTGLDPAFVRMRFDKLIERLQADLDALDITDYELMHDIRKRAKQVRYVAEQFGDVLGKDAVPIAKQMKAQQDHLGALCDAKVNREIVGTYLLRDDVPESLARELVLLIR